MRVMELEEALEKAICAAWDGPPEPVGTNCPETYQQWKDRLEHECKDALTKPRNKEMSNNLREQIQPAFIKDNVARLPWDYEIFWPHSFDPAELLVRVQDEEDGPWRDVLFDIKLTEKHLPWDERINVFRQEG